MEENITNNIKAQNHNIEVLKKHFGQCFDKSGNFDFEKFKHELSENEIDFKTQFSNNKIVDLIKEITTV